MDPVTNDVETNKGNIVIGVMLVLTGLAVVLQRSGALDWSQHWTLWPLVLGGIGLAHFLQTPPGRPKRGLLFLTAAAWLLLSEAGVVTIADSWPIVIIVFGLMVAFNGGTRWHPGRGRRRWSTPEQPVGVELPGDSTHVPRARGRHRRSLSPLAVVGTWIAIVVAFQVSGVRSFTSVTEASTSDRLRVVSVMARSDHASRATAFQGGDITNVMGKSEVDLREASLAPGASATVQLFSAMGEVVLRVPSTWTVETGSVTAFGGVRNDRRDVRDAGGVRDERDVPVERDDTGAAPRLVVRGLVIFGRLRITS